MFRFNPKTTLAVLGFIIPLLALAFFVPFLRPPVMSVFKAPLYLCDLIGREISGIFFYHRNYAARNTLARRVDYLNSNLIAMDELKTENKRLLDLLSLKQQLPYKVIAARVIGREPSNWASTVIINKGSASGIKKGAASVSFLGLAGRVADVNQSTSKVTLINDPGVNVSARTQRSRQEGLVCGSLSGSLIFKLLPKDCDIVTGDTVVTSGMSRVYPKGLLIGTVSAIARDFSGLGMYAVIKPAVDLSSLEEVLIIVE
ncbi:MAG: rod shape-determining protein MreC [Candidatus Omnitrophica bacterium]|nr:rod shape-determining protein MreC [Candidatus Omnitrophota bacterium]